MAQPQITVYTSTSSGFSQRVLIALEEAKAEYTTHLIDLSNKPSWYLEKVNPVGKVPAITYGGPQTAAESPSPSSVKLRESLVILEFIAETFPDSRLHPSSLVERAHARLFISVVDSKFLPALWAFVLGTAPYTDLLDGLAEVQALLPPDRGFAVGEWSIADAAITPFICRLWVFVKNEVGKYPLGDGRKVLDELESPKFARLRKYIEDVRQRPSVKATFDEAQITEALKKSTYFQRG